MYRSAQKVIRTIDSCQNLWQLETARRLYRAWVNLFEVDSIKHIHNTELFDISLNIQARIFERVDELKNEKNVYISS